MTTTEISLSKSAAKELLNKDTDQLYEELGLRQAAVNKNLLKQGSYEPEIDRATHMGVAEDMKKIGIKMFNRLHIQAYKLICGDDPEDKKDRDQIMGALGVSEAAAVVALSSVFVGTFGLAAAIAGVVAALIIKRFAAPTVKDGYKTMCMLWKEHVPEDDK